MRFVNSRSMVKGLYETSAPYPAPANISYFWNFGMYSFIGLCFQIISGVFLAAYYIPDLDIAFQSLDYLNRSVESGWLIRVLHANVASFFFGVAYIHMFRGFYGRGTPVIFFVLIIATVFLGYVLLWGQMSYWAATVITNLFLDLPCIVGVVSFFSLLGYILYLFILLCLFCWKAINAEYRYYSIYINIVIFILQMCPIILSFVTGCCLNPLYAQNEFADCGTYASDEALIAEEFLVTSSVEGAVTRNFSSVRENEEGINSRPVQDVSCSNRAPYSEPYREPSQSISKIVFLVFGMAVIAVVTAYLTVGLGDLILNHSGWEAAKVVEKGLIQIKEMPGNFDDSVFNGRIRGKTETLFVDKDALYNTIEPQLRNGFFSKYYPNIWENESTLNAEGAFVKEYAYIYQQAQTLLVKKHTLINNQFPDISGRVRDYYYWCIAEEIVKSHITMFRENGIAYDREIYDKILMEFSTVRNALMKSIQGRPLEMEKIMNDETLKMTREFLDMCTFAEKGIFIFVKKK